MKRFIVSTLLLHISMVYIFIERGIYDPIPDDDLTIDDQDLEEWPMCLSFDGDYPQIESIFKARFLDLAQKEKIELQKFPGGSSMQYQPNDVMRSHAILKRYFRETYKKTHRFHEPTWLEHIRSHLYSVLGGRMDNASKKCFMTFFLNGRQLFQLHFRFPLLPLDGEKVDCTL